MKRIIAVWIAGALALTLAGCSATESKDSNRVTITVTEKGFEPQVVKVSAGKPVTLVVTRSTTKTCATEVVMAEYGINRPLPLGEAVEITFTPKAAGEIHYACAMDMYKGTIQAQ